MSWTEFFLSLADKVSTKSKDTATKVGAVIVNERNVVVSLGWNGFPRGVQDLAHRMERPIKYKFTEHAERNAIYNAASEGHALKGSTIYVNTMFPCADCARAIIQSGIVKIICKEPDWNSERWGIDYDFAKGMLEEANVKMEFV